MFGRKQRDDHAHAQRVGEAQPSHEMKGHQEARGCDVEPRGAQERPADTKTGGDRVQACLLVEVTVGKAVENVEARDPSPHRDHQERRCRPAHKAAGDCDPSATRGECKGDAQDQMTRPREALE